MGKEVLVVCSPVIAWVFLSEEANGSTRIEAVPVDMGPSLSPPVRLETGKHVAAILPAHDLYRIYCCNRERDECKPLTYSQVCGHEAQFKACEKTLARDN